MDELTTEMPAPRRRRTLREMIAQWEREREQRPRAGQFSSSI